MRRTLFNHHCVDSYPGLIRITGMALNSGRILAASAPDDVVQLHPDLAPGYPAMCDHYRQAGLAVADTVVWNVDPAVANDFPTAEYSVYMFGPPQHYVRPNLRRLDATKTFDQKNAFIAWCRNRGFPIPETRLFMSDEKPDLTGTSFPTFVKASVSATGLDVFRCRGRAEVEAAMRQIGADYQIQAEVPACAFLNVQYRASGGDAEFIATTEQLLDGFTHIGSRYPSAYNPRRVTDLVAAELVGEGLEDVFALDVAVIPGADGGFEIALLEVNPRYNAATYPTLIAERLGATAWLATSMQTRERQLDAVLHRLGDALYDPRRRTGIVLIGWGSVQLGKLMVMLVGDADEQAIMRAQLDVLS